MIVPRAILRAGGTAENKSLHEANSLVEKTKNKQIIT